MFTSKKKEVKHLLRSWKDFKKVDTLKKSRILLPKSSGNVVPTCKSSKNS